VNRRTLQFFSPLRTKFHDALFRSFRQVRAHEGLLCSPFVRVPKALECSRRISKRFSERMAKFEAHYPFNLRVLRGALCQPGVVGCLDAVLALLAEIIEQPPAVVM